MQARGHSDQFAPTPTPTPKPTPSSKPSTDTTTTPAFFFLFHPAFAVELELQRLLAEHLDALEEGMTLIRREYPTPVGPVDLLCRDAGGGTVAVEVKRRGEIDGVEQLTRYLEFLNRDHRLAPVRGLLVAQIVKPQARTLAEDRGIGWREVDYEELAGAESDVLRLF